MATNNPDARYKIHRKPKIDYSLLNQQEEEIRNYILNETTGKDKILVLAYEASMGKSRITDSTLKLNPDKKILYVKKFNDEQKVSMQRILDTNENDIFQLLVTQRNVVLIDASNSYDYEHNNPGKLKNANIVIISHKRYQLISNNQKLKKLYSEGRDILIIDEYVEPEVYTLNEEFFRDKSKLFPNDFLTGKDHIRAGDALKIEECFEKIFKMIEDDKEHKLGTNKNMRLINIIDDIQDDIDKNIDQELLSLLKNKVNMLDAYYKENRKFLLMTSKCKEYEYQEYFDCLKAVLGQQIIYEKCLKKGRTVFSFHTLNNFSYWTLNHNLILDASGGILYEYKLNPLFQIERKTRVFDYSNTNAHFCSTKSFQTDVQNNYGKNANESIKNFLSILSDYIVGNNKTYDKTFIVLYEKYERLLESLIWKNQHNGKMKGLVSVNHYKNLVGKNDWRDFNKIYLPMQFNIPEYLYLLYYSFASNKILIEGDFEIVVEDDLRKFKNSDIEKVKLGHQVHETYQTLKRINRDNTYKSDFYIITNDERIIGLFPNLFKNIVVKMDFDIPLEEIKTETKKKKKAKWENIKKLMSELLNDPNGSASLKSNWAKAIETSKDYLGQYIERNNYLNQYIDIKRSFPGRKESKKVDRLYLR